MGKNDSAIAQLNAAIGGKGKKKGGKGKKGRKIGRYAKSPSCMRYKGERRWERNKVRRMERHIKHFPADGQAGNILSQIG